MMADYNGWTDQPEEEREAIDQLEMTPTAAVCGLRATGPGELSLPDLCRGAHACALVSVGE